MFTAASSAFSQATTDLRKKDEESLLMKTDLSPIDPDLFRSVMRRLASSVTVITTAHGDGIHGMTATAVCSVCAVPPTILIVVNRSARSHPLIDSSRTFVVNILAEDQQEIAKRFAGKLEDQFVGVGYHVGGTSGPILHGAAAHLECKVASQSDVGTHTVFVGEVVGGDVAEAFPLVYHDGRYPAFSDRNL